MPGPARAARRPARLGIPLCRRAAPEAAKATAPVRRREAIVATAAVADQAAIRMPASSGPAMYVDPSPTVLST